MIGHDIDKTVIILIDDIGRVTGSEGDHRLANAGIDRIVTVGIEIVNILNQAIGITAGNHIGPGGSAGIIASKENRVGCAE